MSLERSLVNTVIQGFIKKKCLMQAFGRNQISVQCLGFGPSPRRSGYGRAGGFQDLGFADI